MKILCIFKQYKKTEILSFAIKKPMYFNYFILPSISESPNHHERRLLVQDTVANPSKHKLKFELGNPIIVVLNLKKQHTFHNSARVDWLSTKVCVFPQCHFLSPYVYGNLHSQENKSPFL